MKNILLVCAMEKESKRIVDKLKMNKVSDFVYKNENITILITGIGKQRTAINLTEYLCKEEKPDLIVNIGYAGSTDIPIGKWVGISKSYNYEWFIPGEEQYSFLDLGNKSLETITGKGLEYVECYSAESFVTETNLIGHIAFDMELHSVVVVGEMYNIPVMAFKKISDNLSLEKYYDHTENNAEVFELESSIELIKEIK